MSSRTTRRVGSRVASRATRRVGSRVASRATRRVSSRAGSHPGMGGRLPAQIQLILPPDDARKKLAKNWPKTGQKLKAGQKMAKN